MFKDLASIAVFMVQFACVTAFGCFGIALIGWYFNNAVNDYSVAISFFLKCGGVAIGVAGLFIIVILLALKAQKQTESE